MVARKIRVGEGIHRFAHGTRGASAGSSGRGVADTVARAGDARCVAEHSAGGCGAGAVARTDSVSDRDARVEHDAGDASVAAAGSSGSNRDLARAATAHEDGCGRHEPAARAVERDEQGASGAARAAADGDIGNAVAVEGGRDGHDGDG